ncbi:MAG: hypothetical protein KAS32_07270, partial [Candidatus Peribacteraceae bacterium]|nr:hypothetical protein [Candidatus Peribacteraceae bacterium]
MTQVSQTYNVVNKEGFLEKLGKLSQRYKVEFEVTWAEPYKEKLHLPHGDFEAEPVPLTIWRFPCEVIFSFTEFKIEGHSYLGAIRDNDMMGLITIHGNNLTDGLDLSSWVKGFESIPCHKCNRKHKRTVGHLFREDKTGDVNVYGSGCAKKYFGINFDRILGFFETINLRFDEWFEEDYHRINRFHIDSEELLKQVYFIINKYGYVSKTKADNYMESTAEFVTEFLENRPSGIKNEEIEKVSNGIDFSVLWNKSYVENESNKSNFDHNIEVIQEKMKYNHLSQKDY